MINAVAVLGQISVLIRAFCAGVERDLARGALPEALLANIILNEDIPLYA